MKTDASKKKSALQRLLSKAKFPEDAAAWRKMGAIFSLQVAHDLPNALTSTMVSTLFVRRFGLSLEYQGIFYLPLVVTAIKWLWAPVVDNRWSPKYGRRRSWLGPLTLLVALTYCCLALVEPSMDTLFVIVGILMIKQVFYSTQEIAADAYVVENLEPQERGIGSSVVWLGKEFGQVIGFAGLLYVTDRYGWTAAFLTAAGLFILFNLPAILRKEPAAVAAASTKRAKVRDYFQRAVNLRILAIVFAVAFTVQMPVAAIGPFLSSKGLTLSEIGIVLGISASVGAILSLSIASVVISRYGAKKVAIGLLFISPLAAPPFLWLAAQETATATVVVLIILWSTLCMAPVRMALYAARIGWTSEGQAGTDMTMQQSTWFIGYAVAGAVGGVIAGQLGWVAFFAINTIATAAALILFIRLHDGIEDEVAEWRASEGEAKPA
ncbi:MAG: MFS transporter [Pseudomonadota bacterium]